jgi:uroporphyrin-III C-methyltransferase
VGKVYLIGAGPGDPDLLTVKAARLLSRASTVLHDSLVSREVLQLIPRDAEIIDVGKRCGQKLLTQDEINQLLISYANRPLGGESLDRSSDPSAAGSASHPEIIRLKGGDPVVFGRAGEEIEALRRANIPFEIVPGITAAFAVAAALQTPLTDRNSASKLILATAHHAAGKLSPIAWEGAFPPQSTLVLYMPGRDFAELSASLIASGIAPETPVAAVSNASTPKQHIVATTLAELPHSEPGPAPLLLLIGKAIQL